LHRPGADALDQLFTCSQARLKCASPIAQAPDAPGVDDEQAAITMVIAEDAAEAVRVHRCDLVDIR
jgi:hypothetical protein